MRVSKDTQIAGVPATELRRVFRTMRGLVYVGIDELRAAVSEGLGLTMAQRKTLVDQLIAEGYIERSRTIYELSEQGLRLAAASTGKPIPRVQAETLLAEFIERARAINQSDSWYRVAQIELFGSLLDSGGFCRSPNRVKQTISCRPGRMISSKSCCERR